MSAKYASFERLMNSKDKNGKDPGWLFLVSRQRGPGKTYSAGSILMKYVFDSNFERSFGLICRTKNQLGNFAKGVLGVMFGDKYPAWSLREQVVADTYSEIIISKGKDENLVEHVVGYVIPLSSAQRNATIKNYGGSLYTIDYLFFDEIIPMDKQGYLASNEMDLFFTVYDTLARGNKDGDSRLRNVKVLAAANCIDPLNPYFVNLDISKTIQENTKFCRGNGWVYERTFIEGLNEEFDANPVHAAVKRNVESINFKDNLWLISNKSLIEKPVDWGRSTYVCTISHEGKDYALKYYRNVMMYYIDHSVDKSFGTRYNMTVNGEKNYPVLRNSVLSKIIKDAISSASIRFADGICKNLIFDFYC